MGELSLGLDIGPTSIGWALTATDSLSGKVLATGVRIFPEGVERNQQGGEKAKSQDRRTARGMRRQIARRRARRAALRRRLTAAGLLPTDPAQLQQVLATNPYPLRARARHNRLDPFEIGRILLHLAQRRGFLSNRKSDRADNDKGLHAEINSLAARLEAGNQTLGEFLAHRDSSFRHTAPPPLPTDKERKSGSIAHTVRRLHTRRSMYIDEFEQLWAAQQPFHPAILTPELRADLYEPTLNAAQKQNWLCRGLLFGQRRMYWPRSIVGRCDLERAKRRCPVAHREAQRFRILQEVNNLRTIDIATGEERTLDPDQRSALIAFLESSKQRTFDEIRKRLKLPDSARFNLEGPDRDKLKGHLTDYTLAEKKHIGKRYRSLTESAKDAIVHILIHEDREDEALAALQREPCNLSPEEAQQALAANLPDKHAAYSLDAIRKLLPHLERGLRLMANDASDSALHAAGYLRPDQREIKTADFLRQAPDLPNPLVRAALVEVRRVVNMILRELCDNPAGPTGGRRPDVIRIELAREARKSIDQRTQMRFDNKKRQDARAAAAEAIEAAGVKATPGAIRKYLLWKEQGGDCAYSFPPLKISLSQLLSDAVDVDHILPRWQSLDDSMMNKVVAFRSENHAKGQRTPRQWLEASHPDKWGSVIQRANKLPYPKLQRFLQPSVILDDFVNRQFTDTAYITTAVVQYLKSIGNPVQTSRGQMTAELRRLWGLNGILGDTGEKNRSDHRHHAVDAAVVALITPARLNALAAARGRDIPPPWPSLRADLESSITAINVSHRPQRRIHGALHKDTFYGRTEKHNAPGPAPGSAERPWAKGWLESKQTVVRRKPVDSITDAKQLAKVRDPAIRAILESHVSKLCGGTLPQGKFPPKCFEGANAPHMPSGIPIRRVRSVEEGLTFRQVSPSRSYQLVQPGSNHHVCYYTAPSPRGQMCTARVVSMWDAAARARKNLALIDTAPPTGAAFLCSLSIGESFIMRTEDGEALCAVQKITNAEAGVRLYYRPNVEAPHDESVERTLSPAQVLKRQVRKVLIDPIGRIRRTRD